MKKIKQILIVWISIYPPLTILLLAFGDQLNGVPLAMRTLVLTLILVPLMILVLIPFWTFVFNYSQTRFVRRKTKSTR